VLIHLLSNGVKFTDQGEIKLELKLLSMKGDEQLIRFVVADSGIGIPDDFVEMVFEPFKQVDERLSRRYGGTGLGLAISHHLVELMGGSIDVKSEQGKGSRFFFELPLQVASQEVEVPLIAESQSTAEPKAPEVLRSLLVEDDEINRQVIGRLLEHLGVTTDIAKNGLEGCSMSLEQKYDLIFMDIYMPEMNGIEAVLEIRGNPKNRNVETPIIALTAMTSEEDRDECFRAGMNQYIKKPIDFDLLKATVNLYRS